MHMPNYSRRKLIRSIRNNLRGINVTFSVELFPTDMKYLASVSVELNNAAHFFSSFANVSKDDMMKMNRTFSQDGLGDFAPWQYEDRIRAARLVEKRKKKLSHKELASRTKVTSFIAKQKSRQEYEPLFGPIIDQALIEPLHLTNNNWQFLFMQVFDIALGRSNISSTVNKISSFPDNSPFRLFLRALKIKV